MKITVVGTGYVGLVSGVCFAEFGFKVTCVDNNQAKIDGLNNGVIPIYEPGLDKLLEKNKNDGRLKFTSDLASSVEHADIIFIAVGTPSKKDGSADLSFVYDVVDNIVPVVNRNAVLVVKSTVPVGTTRNVKKFLLDRGVDLEVAFNPEFLKEGAAIDDFMHPDRVILGVESERARLILSQVYRPLYIFNTPIVFTNLETAELAKYASNAFLAMKVTFINEIANLCEKCGADVNEVALSMGLDKRIGDRFLQAGPGYGGSCFPKDTCALVQFSNACGVEMPLVAETIKSNALRRQKMVDKIVVACDGVSNKNIAVLGVTFKANTDDMRDSPSIEIISGLISKGANIKIYDPSYNKSNNVIFHEAQWCANAGDACKDVDAIVIITDWNEFKAMDLKKLRESSNCNLLVDLRNMYSISEAENAGFRYYSVGRNL